MIYFSGDLHLNHSLMAGLRGFYFIEDMDEWIIQIWNETIKTGDDVYFLGDFAFGKPDVIKKYRAQLRGKIHLILGNHDYRNHINKLSQLFSSINDLLTIKYNHKKIILCHYAMRVWDSSHFNSYHLYAHSHGNLEGQGKSFDIGWDRFHRPVSIDEALEIFETLPDNINFIHPHP